MHEVIGVTGWTYGELAGYTLPQLYAALAGRHRMLRPLVQAMVDVSRATHLSDLPGPNGEPSSVTHVLQTYAAQQAGRPPTPSGADQRFTRAVNIVLMAYRGNPDGPGTPAAPFPGMTPREARALIEWVRDGRCPPDVWATDLLPHWPDIAAAASQPTAAR